MMLPESIADITNPMAVPQLLNTRDIVQSTTARAERSFTAIKGPTTGNVKAAALTAAVIAGDFTGVTSIETTTIAGGRTLFDERQQPPSEVASQFVFGVTAVTTTALGAKTLLPTRVGGGGLIGSGLRQLRGRSPSAGRGTASASFSSDVVLLEDGSIMVGAFSGPESAIFSATVSAGTTAGLESTAFLATAPARIITTTSTLDNLIIPQSRVQIVSGKAPSNAPKAKAPLYEVDTAYNLRKNPAHGVRTDTIAEHTPQTKWSRDLIPGHSDVNTVGREPAIRVTAKEAAAITHAETLTQVPASAREALAIKIRILRQHTNAPNSALQELIELSRKRHPTDYLPLHRMEP